MREAARQLASSGDRVKYKAIRKKLDDIDAQKKRLRDQLSKEADDNRRSKIWDELQKLQDKAVSLDKVRSNMLKRYRGLRVKEGFSEAHPDDLMHAGTVIEEFNYKGGELLRDAFNALANADPESKFLTESRERKIQKAFNAVVADLEAVLDSIPEDDDSEEEDSDESLKKLETLLKKK